MTTKRRRFTLLVLLAVSLSCAMSSPSYGAKQKQPQQRQMMKIGDEIVTDEVGKSFVRAQQLIGSKDYQQAESILATIAQQSPKSSFIQFKYGFVLLKLRKFQDALSQAKKCVEIAPNFAGGWSLLGEASMELNLDDQAKEAYKKALAIEPNGENADIIKDNLKDLENPQAQQPAPETVAANEEINNQNRIALKLNRALSLCDSAAAHGAQKQFDKGIMECREAIKIAPDSDQIKENFVAFLNNYAADCIQQQKVPQAEALMKEAIAFQNRGGVSMKLRLTTLKNYLALLNFQGRSQEAKQVELQMKSVSTAAQ